MYHVPLDINDIQVVFHQRNSVWHLLMKDIGISEIKTRVTITVTVIHTSLNMPLVVFMLLAIRIFCIRANFLRTC